MIVVLSNLHWNIFKSQLRESDRENIEVSTKDEHEVNCFLNDDIEEEKWTAQREEEKTSESPFKVGTGLFFVSQFSAQFRCHA